MYSQQPEWHAHHVIILHISKIVCDALTISQACTRAGAGNLKALVAGSTSREEKLALLGFEVSYGSIEGFRIELSTLPGRAGASVLQEPMALAYVRRALDDPSQALMLGALPPKGGWKRAA